MGTICFHSSLVNSNLTISQELLETEDLRENFESIKFPRVHDLFELHHENSGSLSRGFVFWRAIPDLVNDQISMSLLIDQIVRSILASRVAPKACRILDCRGSRHRGRPQSPQLNTPWHATIGLKHHLSLICLAISSSLFAVSCACIPLFAFYGH